MMKPRAKKKTKKTKKSKRNKMRTKREKTEKASSLRRNVSARRWSTVNTSSNMTVTDWLA
jgi:hypothetical protein